MPRKSSKPNTKRLIAALEEKSRQARQQFQQAHASSHAWLKENNLDLGRLRQHSKKLLTSGAVVGSLLLSPPIAVSNTKAATTVKQRLAGLNYFTNDQITKRLIGLTKPATDRLIGHLDQDRERSLEAFLLDNYGIKAAATLEGQQLNHSVGIIGYEQHLKRFPGDDVNFHDDEQIAGIAPGLGAWGFFAPARDSFDQDDYLREKYYFAVQTLYLPNWNRDHRTLAPWYKYRKMIAINPQNGHMVVGVVADAGPAEWTGKHFGGSPEAMKALDLHLKSRKGKIILLFVDDPQNQLPLGPVTGPSSGNIQTI